MSEEASTPSERRARRGDGATYLVVADDSEEFRTALRYACQLVRNNRGRLGILRILENQDFQHWGAVEEKVKKELREQGELFLWNVAKLANEQNGVIPSLYFAEGEPPDALMKTIEGDENITQLILGNRAGSSPGPLVSYCIGKGLERMRVPLVVVPGHLKDFA